MPFYRAGMRELAVTTVSLAIPILFLKDRKTIPSILPPLYLGMGR
jgi:hypothetical protein